MSKLFSRTTVSGASLTGANLKAALTTLWDALNSRGFTDSNRTTITADATLATTDCGLLLIDATAGNIVLTLPASGTATDDALYELRRIDSSTNTVTVQRASTDSVEGATSIALPINSTTKLQIPGGSANWRILAINGPTAVATAGGTADAITASFRPAITSLDSLNGVPLHVRAASANATATPTFTPNSGVISADTIVKGNNLPLAAGDIAGAGHWLQLQRDATLGKWVLLNPATGVAAVASQPVVRQTVLSGPVDSSGYPAFGGSVGTATLTLSGTLKATAAAGGDANYTGSITNPAFTSPAGTGTGFLTLSITSAGVVTAGVRTLAPIHQFGGAYSTVNGQLTINKQEGTVKVGNGSTATQVYEVCIGECPHTSGAWSGTPIYYALNGEYDSGLFAVVANTLYSKNANIGQSCDLFLYFSTSATGLDGGGTTNEEVPYGGPGDAANANYRGCLFGQSTRNIVRARTQDLFQVMDSSGVTATTASGYVRIRAKKRGL